MRFVRNACVSLAVALSLAMLAAGPAAATSGKSTYLENKYLDYLFRGQSFTAPATVYVGLIAASRGLSGNIRSAAVAIGDTVLPQTPNGRLYKATTGGTSGPGEPTWCVTSGCTTTDGAAVWTEQTGAIAGGTFPEVSASATGYARVAVASSLVNWAGTQGAATTTASSGTTGQTSNNVSIAFGSPTAAWGTVYGWVLMDAPTVGSGNLLYFAALAAPKTVNSGDAAPAFGPAALTITEQ